MRLYKYSSLRTRMNLDLIDFLALDTTRESLDTLLIDSRISTIDDVDMLDYPIQLEETGKVGFWATWYDFHCPLL